MVRLANGIIPWKEGGAAFDYWFNPIKPKTDQRGELNHFGISRKSTTSFSLVQAHFI
jgi:hypothetical protein